MRNSYINTTSYKLDLPPSPVGEGWREENKNKHLDFPSFQPSPFAEGADTCVDTYALWQNLTIALCLVDIIKNQYSYYP